MLLRAAWLASIASLLLLSAACEQAPAPTRRATPVSARPLTPQASPACETPGQDAAWCAPRRFIVMGDTGDGSPTQHRVAEGAQRRCDLEGGCDGLLLLGDTIYPAGPVTDEDARFTLMIDRPYRELRLGAPPAPGDDDARPRLPIYPVLGNHDLGGPGLNSGQIALYLRYAERHPWFVFPDELWERQLGHVHLIGLHTNPMVYTGLLLPHHAELVRRVASTSNARWIVALGHHPYRSNGRHGDAGHYDGLSPDAIPSGARFEAWIEDHLCPHADLYLAGHDHNLQWFADYPAPTCPTRFAVSGAGAKTTPLRDDAPNALAFGADTPGFLLLELRHDRARALFCDADGEITWQTAWEHGGDKRSGLPSSAPSPIF